MRHLCYLWLALILAACSPNQDPDRLTLGGPFEFTSQDPSRDGYLYTRLQVAQTLLEVDAQGQLLPGLAERWQTSGDGLTWHFALHDDVRFHDGAPFDAEAAAHAIRIALNKPGVIRAAPITEVSVESPTRLAIHLSSPYSPLGAVMAHYTTAMLSPGSYDASGEVTWMQGTGPYKIESFDPPHRLGVIRFDGYWGELAHIERAVYLTGHRAESRALQVMAGQTDIIYTLDPASLALLRRREDVHVHSDTIPRTIQIKLDSGHPYLAERAAREALSLALDREGIASRILRVPGGETNQLIPPSLADWRIDTLAPIKRDLPRARELLASLGWQAAGDGVLQRDGKRFALRLITYADRPELFVVATAIQAQLQEIGVALDVSVVNSSGIPSGHHDGTLQLALIARNYGNVADPLSLLQADYGNGGNGDWGAMGWHDEELPALLKTLQAEPDPDRYRHGARRVAEILAEELPVIPVLFYTQQTAVSARVRGFTFDPYERNYRIAEMSFVP